MFNRRNDCTPETGKCAESNNVEWVVNETMEEIDSQNFCLKMTQASVISDTEVTNDDDVIVISDSSPEKNCSPKYVPKLKTTIMKFPVRKSVICLDDSTDSGSVKVNDDNYLKAWRENKKSVVSNYQRKNTELENMYTSDETSSSSTDFLKNYIINSDNTSSSYISGTPDSDKTDIQSALNTKNEKYITLTSVINNKELNYSNVNVQPAKATPPILKYDVKRILTPKDAKNILKNIRSRQLVYDSPKVQEAAVRSDEETDDDDNIVHPAISPRSRLIPETPESENEIIPDSQPDTSNHYKSQDKYFDTSKKGESVVKDTDAMYSELSERKKKQIAQWLMTNVPEPQDDSCSIVPPSNNDTASGNSSLERLEENYETPNNREKIRQQFNGNDTKIPDTHKTPRTIVRQKTINEFVQKTKDNKLILPTSKKNTDTFLTPTAREQDNVDITGCAHILDKLYGKSWRDKADVLFPNSEPRKQTVPTKNRAVQTDRRQTKREFYVSNTDNNSDTSSKDLNLQDPSNKQTIQNTAKRKDSFINDWSSESDSESFYYTALTNPITSATSTQSKPKTPPIRQRVLAICDTDTEDENQKNDRGQESNVRGRKLSFSFDESESSSTSEFDPDDIVPPKPISKKGSTKPVRQLPKFDIRSEFNINTSKSKKRNSFLASLSENVPITEAHPDAKKYRLNYKDNKEDLCNYLYKLYNEKVFDKELPENMTIEWNVRMRGTAGYCYNKKSIKTLGGVVRSSRIVLATKILDTPDRLRDTLIHEMCHAAAWLVNGICDGHGPLWTKWANKAMQTFPEIPPIRRCHDYKIKTKFTYRCVGCGYSIGRHSKSLDVERKRCGHCYGKFELLINKTTKSGTIQMQTPKREPSKFALFVKENYNSVKKERNLKHGEVMKILGQQFSAIKIAQQQEVNDNPDTPSY